MKLREKRLVVYTLTMEAISDKLLTLERLQFVVAGGSFTLEESKHPEIRQFSLIRRSRFNWFEGITHELY